MGKSRGDGNQFCDECGDFVFYDPDYDGQVICPACAEYEEGEEEE